MAKGVAAADDGGAGKLATRSESSDVDCVVGCFFARCGGMIQRRVDGRLVV